MKNPNIRYFECECESAEHTFRLISQNVWDDDFPPELFISLQLNQRTGFFGRCWLALKYVFGHQSRFGHWDNIAIREEDIEKLTILLHQHRVKLLKHRDYKKSIK